MSKFIIITARTLAAGCIAFAPAAAPGQAAPLPAQSLLLDLDATKGVSLDEVGRVIRWRNQAPGTQAREFVPQPKGRKDPDSGRPAQRTDAAVLPGKTSLIFRQQELLCADEDTFDGLTTGKGHTWVVLAAMDEQRVGLKDVNSFFGNLRNGGNYEGLWACVKDDNTLWYGGRNGLTFGRFDNNNTQAVGPKLERSRWHVFAGRMPVGTGTVKMELFVDKTAAVATTDFPVSDKANPGRMAVGQERDAIEHPGAESFDGEIARLLIWERPLTDEELSWVFQLLTPAPQTQASAVKIYTEWPFSAEEAKRRQNDTATATGFPVEQSLALPGGTLVKFRLIPAGKYVIGSPPSEDGHEGDERQHPETVAEPFYMMETQLTVAQYRALMQSEPSDAGEGNDPQMPAGILYRDTADKVLPALAKFAPAGWKVILPDHVRLEYAARAGIATMNPGGDKVEDAVPFAWSRENSGGKVHRVAQKTPNAWGLYDVIGNRWHWFWRAGEGYGDASTSDHIVYGGHARAESGGNGVRLANIMISNKPEGARFALIRADSPVPKGHPETRR